MKTACCKVCGSNKIMDNLTITDHGHMDSQHDLSIHIKTSNRIIFNTFKKTKIKARVCGNCGNVELSVNSPQQLWEAYQKTNKL